MLWNILLQRLSLYTDKIVEDHQCGFQCNRSTTDQIFRIRRILEKKMGVRDSTSAIQRFFSQNIRGNTERAIIQIISRSASRNQMHKSLKYMFIYQNQNFGLFKCTKALRVCSYLTMEILNKG
jgi:hypothetical protein